MICSNRKFCNNDCAHCGVGQYFEVKVNTDIIKNRSNLDCEYAIWKQFGHPLFVPYCERYNCLCSKVLTGDCKPTCENCGCDIPEGQLCKSCQREVDNPRFNKKACPVCSRLFTPARKDQKYCGKTCKRTSNKRASRGAVVG